MSDISSVQSATSTQASDIASAVYLSNQGTGFANTMGQVTAGAPVLTPSIAQSLMYRSMTTGVPTAEMDQYGGYNAVKTMFDSGAGSYSLDALSNSQQQQLAQQVAGTGVGNMSLLIKQHMSLSPTALSEMSQNGIDQGTINQIYQQVQAAQGEAGAGLPNNSSSAPKLSPEIAQSLMQRSMTTGVPKSEMDLYGGYDAVKAAYDAGSGSYSVDAIPAQQKQQLAMQVAATGVGNFALPVATKTSVGAAAIQAMKDNGIDVSTIDSITKSLAQATAQDVPAPSASAPFVDSNSYIDTLMGSLGSNG